MTVRMDAEQADMDARPPETLSGDAAERELLEYQQVSPAAVAALVLGLLSPLTFVSLLLLALPAAALAFGVAGIAAIRENPRGLSGAGLAVGGMALAAFFALAPLTHTFVRRQILSWQATQFTTGWVRLVNERKFAQAYELSRPAAERQPLDDAAAFYARNKDAQAQVEEFYASPTLRRLRGLAGQGEPRFVSTVDIRSVSGIDVVVQEFVWETEGAEPVRFRLEARRAIVPGSNVAAWNFYDANEPR